ncbi:hydroxyethylthiazole kinase [Yersinia kristensenii]|uniref:Hydroxyethylthiazole kinase n=1 Tax=Yersinia kristensenii TaxID=28152 RepID=A0AB73NHB0_YERKR|nr:hydroxyethylthiazole kinase [Yersinia kristensenii]OVZ78918.1 hydroxyethylthiazole kinase [Yersinia kristensenii]PJG63495.1 hydroxyethylthiazole kinase [Yersinia kristensenii]CFR22292.1 hydroxyethylthiazole kinase [Yersinia kristensenii]CNG88582.1 hydroxyethylthiazole kinase [Yersinia kristensenii]CNK41445.1 hydroxyethylthiazole kinase [Yersinia kristensenii]
MNTIHTDTSISPTLFPDALATASWHQFRATPPLVHCLTNEVVQSFTANVLLALGAFPAMVVEPEEAAQFSAMANSLLINIGTLHRARAESMLSAVIAANQAGTPWVLDPVAVGGLAYRTDFARHLLTLKPAAIRGNASEIMALSGMATMGRGVDSVDTSLAALPAARQLARQAQTVVAVTGEVDYVTDGQRDFAVAGGDKLMTRVVGTGCALSAVVAAFCALEGDRLHHVATACRIMSQVGGQVSQYVAGPGSFVSAFLDGLYQLETLVS